MLFRDQYLFGMVAEAGGSSENLVLACSRHHTYHSIIVGAEEETREDKEIMVEGAGDQHDEEKVEETLED